MEEQDIDWIIRDRNRYARARTREHKMRGAGSHTAYHLDRVIAELDELLENLGARFGRHIEAATREKASMR